MTTRLQREDGMAVVVALMAMMLMTALGMSLVLTTSSETMIAGNFRTGGEALYAADAILERSMDDLLTIPDWNKLLDGSLQSGFIDGLPSGERSLPDGTKLDLSQVLSFANCDKPTTCSGPDMDAYTEERPWGVNNPRWQLFAYGNVTDLLPTGTINSPFYVVVMIGDDPSENDNTPLIDGGPPAEPGGQQGQGQPNKGTGVIALRAEAFGPRGAHKVIEMTVAKTDTTELERGYTGQRGQDEQNRRARKAAVQSPGKKLDMQTLSGSGGIS
jgi:hypothetical protein